MDWLEGRRRRAWELLEAGWQQVDVAEALGVTKGAVSQWVKRAREGGIEALRRHPAPGAKNKLSPVKSRTCDTMSHQREREQNASRLVSKPVPIPSSVSGNREIVEPGEMPKKRLIHQAKSG